MKFYTVCKRALALAAAGAMLFAYGCAPEVEEIVFDDIPVAAELEMQEGEQGKTDITELTMAMPANPKKLNPLFASDESILSVMSLVYEPAIKIDGTGRFEPGVIESWEMDNSAMQFTFKVRKDVHFHDGSEVTADDLLATLSRIIQLSTETCPYSRYKDIYGASRKIDDHTFTVSARERTADIFYLMSFPVMSADAVSGVGDMSLPAGTGPYKIESYSADKGIELTVNEGWWKVQPKITAIHIVPKASDEDAVKAYIDGELNCVNTSLLTANSYRAEGTTNVYSVVTPFYDCLLPNMRNPFLRDEKVRKALSLALDRRRIVTDGVLGEGFATETALRPDLWAFEDGDTASFAYDTEKANRLLEEAGYALDEASGFRRDASGSIIKLNLIFLEDEGLQQRKKVAEIIAEMYKDIGIQLNVIEKSQSEYSQLLQAQTFDMAIVTYFTKENNDISFMFDEINNFGSYSGPELTELLTNARMAVYNTELTAAYVKLNNYLSEHLPNIGLYFRVNALIADSRVNNIGKLRYTAVFRDINEWS